MKNKKTFGISKEEKKVHENVLEIESKDMNRLRKKENPGNGKMVISPCNEETVSKSNNDLTGVLSKMVIDSEENKMDLKHLTNNPNHLNNHQNPNNRKNSTEIQKEMKLSLGTIGNFETIEQNNHKKEMNPRLSQDNKFYYIERENQLLINKYGPELYNYSKELENEAVFPNFLQRHKIDPTIRTKMIDWMIEVLYAYHSDPPTLFLAIHLLDMYIAKSEVVLTNNDVHLTGIVCLYIASKMEDLVPLRMSHVKAKIGHNKFSEKKIREKEKLILNTINFQMITTSTYEFVKTFFYDFYHNNQEFIKRFNMYKHIECFENICLFLSKLMSHSEEFSNYKYSVKAIASVVTAFDILRSHVNDMTKAEESFLREWVNYSY